MRNADSGWGARLRRLRHSLESRGLQRTLFDVASNWMTYRADRDLSFDRAFGTDTAGRVQESALGIRDPYLLEKAKVYLSTSRIPTSSSTCTTPSIRR
jgi:hypothetical protein